MFVHELSEVRPGAALNYLAAVRETQGSACSPTTATSSSGLYEVLLTDFEVVTIWASDPAGHESLMRAADEGSDERFAALARAGPRRRSDPLARGAHDAVPRHAPVAGRLAVSPAPASGPLAGLRVIESSLLGPGELTSFLADLGADVIKVEPPQGDYVREMTWPIVEGESLMHLHIHRGKRSVTLDLRNPDAVEVYNDLVRGADAVVEAMRPGRARAARPRVRAPQGGEPARSCSARSRATA